MSGLKKLAVAAGTFAVAVGIGFTMQNGEAQAERLSVAPVLPENLSTPPQHASFVLGADLLPALPLPSLPLVLAALPKGLSAALPEDMAAAPVAELDCTVALSATAAPLAFAELDVSAPCHAGQRATIHHRGMMFAIALDDQGAAELSVPALTEDASFIVALSDGEGAVARLSLPDMADLDRVALQWQGETGLQLHAREFGAAYFTAGHVWRDAPDASMSGGVFTQLGDPTLERALLAEVYTYPAETSPRDGQIALSVEAEVIDATCGGEIAAQSLQTGPSGLETRDLTMTVPGCDSVGEFLILQNMVSDRTVAAR
ncbi:MAG: hypothetical protein CSA72_06110 [Rhodobacterales bacterium]|nr:MAG: hypothetical protein CSA72_06110 [Rhodobacterales bacterium]